MHVTIIGTGNMARGLGRRLIAGGHDVTVLGNDPEAAEAVVTDIGAKDRATAGRSGDAIAGDVVVLAVYYPDAQSAVQDYGDGLSGKVVVDITNPVNESFDGLVTPPDGSAAEELARSATGARVVKLAEDGGLNPIDAGPLKRARELEAMGLLHMTLQSALGTGFSSALKVIA